MDIAKASSESITINNTRDAFITYADDGTPTYYTFGDGTIEFDSAGNVTIKGSDGNELTLSDSDYTRYLVGSQSNEFNKTLTTSSFQDNNKQNNES